MSHLHEGRAIIRDRVAHTAERPQRARKEGEPKERANKSVAKMAQLRNRTQGQADWPPATLWPGSAPRGGANVFSRSGAAAVAIGRALLPTANNDSVTNVTDACDDAHRAKASKSVPTPSLGPEQGRQRATPAGGPVCGHRHPTTVRFKRRIRRGLLAGTLGGIAGAFAMDIFQHHVWKLRGGTEEDEINQNLASAISRRMSHRPLSRGARQRAASIVHYLVGSGMGAAYGVAKPFVPRLGSGAGVPLGIGLWLIADEFAAPAMGLAARRRSSWLRWSNELAAHVLYAATLDAVSRAILPRDSDPCCRWSSTKPLKKSRASKAT